MIFKSYLAVFFRDSVVVGCIQKKKRNKNKNRMLHFLFTQPHLEVLIKDGANHRSQAAVGVSGHVHGYKIIVTYTGLTSEAQRKSFSLELHDGRSVFSFSKSNRTF